MLFFPDNYFVPFTVHVGYVESISDRPDRICAQYRNKKNFVSWLNIVYKLTTELADTAAAVRIMYDIESAQGEQLDIIGRIVVVPRNFLGNVPLNPGQFADPDGAECGDDSQMFSALSIDQDSEMSDQLYRLAIKSKIIKNNSGSTIEDILFGVNFLLPDAQVLRLVDGENMSFSIEFYGNITELQRWALLNGSLIPKPQGVRFNGFLEGVGYVEFNDDSLQFGDSNTQFTGFTGGQ